MTESFERIVTPEMERLIAEGNWTAAEILEEAEIAARATVPEPRQEVSEETVADVVPIVTEPAETSDEHSCPLDIVDIRAREAAIRAGKLKQADGIDGRHS